jgi:hypothetical protein
MARHHVIISGTGRAGTTFLVQLLTELGLDTGHADGAGAPYFENCDAGLELDLAAPDAPYIVKSPWLCGRLDELLKAGDLVIDHALIPMRDLFSAAESRRDVSRRTPPDSARQGTPGGIWNTKDPGSQEAVLAQLFYGLMHTLARHEIPVTLLEFPRTVNDPEYLFERLAFLLGDTPRSRFLEAFRAVSRPELVHDFSARRASA